MTRNWVMYMIFNAVLRLFNLKYKIRLTRDSNPRSLYFCSYTSSTELANLTQEWSSTVDVYTRGVIKANKLLPGLLAAGQVEVPPEVTYISDLLPLWHSVIFMCYAIVCFQGFDVKNLEIYLNFSIRPFFYLTKKSRQNLHISKTKRAFKVK